ncbi:S53 family peptidase [Granulicella sibirica]|uniref:Peptidase S53 domain-containing protein n=1 Tax=Granulicella sibirica TaxID=2479048 RepID=A0A4V1L5V7_9BACT|nr:S53 family peptidase [Granulicella sibirica]RXH57104.1 hypothetical protein GRAN_0414 [Granulicella sibirica]
MATKFWLRALHFGLVPVFTAGLTSLTASPAQAQTAKFATAESVSDADQSQVIGATVWLSLHNRAQLDSKVNSLYDEKSATFHKWMKKTDLSSYTPTNAEVEAVKAELTKQGLTVKSTGPNNMFVAVTGTVATMETAFHTQIKNLSIKGEVVRATTVAPTMTGVAATLVSSISGISPNRFHPTVLHPTDPDTGKKFAGIPMAQSDGLLFSGQCFRDVQTETFKTPGAAVPIGVYVGNRYGQSVTNTAAGTLPPCGYDVKELTTAYGMKPSYAKGLDGTGQTIVIVDAYGSSTIMKDANSFSTLNGLPKLTANNFQVVYPGGAPAATTAANAQGWAEETSLDVEWAHAMAPGANIILLVSPSDYDTDLSGTLFYGIVNGLGSVISNSYSGAELVDLYEYPEELVISNLVTEIGAAFGISVNYSSGDDGDLDAVLGISQNSVSDLGASPYATSVGGTSVALTNKNDFKFQTGWGNNLTKLASSTGAPLAPPLFEGNIGGSGGGESRYFRQPSWQQSLPGGNRQQPDVSMVADPYTGAEFIYSVDGAQYLSVIGGTSLSCPMFSGVWAVANQEAGLLHGTGTLLGQAAPIVAKLAGTPAITDILPYTTPTNVTGLIITKAGVRDYSSAQLAYPLEGTVDYLSAIYNSPFSGSWFTLSFGTDTSLKVTKGWDNVTGYGSPTGLPFIEAAAK